MGEGSEIFFMPFWKPGNIKESMTEEQKNIENLQTEKCKRWVNACSRNDWFSIEKVNRNTHICSLHFVGGKGPTPEHPDPVKATCSVADIEYGVPTVSQRILFEKNKVTNKKPTNKNRKKVLFVKKRSKIE